MRYLASTALALMTVFSTMAVTASDADARRWHRHHGGIALGVGAAILGGLALSRHRYYDDYAYYDDGYYYRPRYYRPYYGRVYGWGGGWGHRHYYRDRRGLGGPAWGRRGHGWAGRHHRH